MREETDDLETADDTARDNLTLLVKVSDVFAPRNQYKLGRHLPFVLGAIFGVLWSLFHLMMRIFSGMWKMADESFPFLVSALFVSHSGRMVPVIGAIMAFIDGAFVGILGGLLFRRFRVQQ